MIYDLIGTIQAPTGVTLTDADGFEYPETVAVVGYHVNVLPPLNDTADIDGNVIVNPLKAHIVEVNTPARVFGGRKDTICLKFADRAEWLALGYEEIEKEITNE